MERNVDIDESLWVESPDTLYTGGVGPCTGLGIINSRKKVGYLGHFMPLNERYEDLLDWAMNDAENPNDLEAVVVGNTPMDKNTLIECGEDLKKYSINLKNLSDKITREIESRGIKIIENHLYGCPEDIYSIQVNPSKNKIKVIKEKFSIDL